MDEQAIVAKAKVDGIGALVVGAVLYDADGYVLIVRRRADDFFGGIFELPSGNVEVGESLAQALVREVAEEVGVMIGAEDIGPEIDHFDYLSQKKNVMKRQVNFAVAVGTRPAVVLSGEHTEYRWILPEEGAPAESGALGGTLAAFAAWRGNLTR